MPAGRTQSWVADGLSERRIRPQDKLDRGSRGRGTREQSRAVRTVRSEPCGTGKGHGQLSQLHAAKVEELCLVQVGSLLGPRRWVGAGVRAPSASCAVTDLHGRNGVLPCRPPSRPSSLTPARGPALNGAPEPQAADHPPVGQCVLSGTVRRREPGLEQGSPARGVAHLDARVEVRQSQVLVRQPAAEREQSCTQALSAKQAAHIMIVKVLEARSPCVGPDPARWAKSMVLVAGRCRCRALA